MSKKVLTVVAGIAIVAVLAAVAISVFRDSGPIDDAASTATTSAPVTTTSDATATTTSRSSSNTLSGFVGVDGTRFVVDGQTYRFVGANFWQGMNLGIEGEDGNRARLEVELDRLQDLGVTNLRVMAASEGPDTEPYRMVPALMIEPGLYNEAVFEGLDYLLAEMAERDMRAVMELNNFWHWSGGMAQYVSWSDGTEIPYPGNWSRFIAYSAGFYACDECQAWYHDHITTVVERVNSYTGLAYRDDPTDLLLGVGQRAAALPERVGR
jgi:mannan endo-1,4-beta-mannosidase